MPFEVYRKVPLDVPFDFGIVVSSYLNLSSGIISTILIYCTMHQAKYSLRWDNYSDHLRGIMKELMNNADYSDVTLVTEDKKHIKANMSVLRACSPVFKDILKNEKNSSMLMYLRGIQHSELESIMQFIYLGEATFYQERMDEFLAVAKSLEIEVLCNADAETFNEPDFEPSQNSPDTAKLDLNGEQLSMKFGFDQIPRQGEQIKREDGLYSYGRSECEQCHKTFCDRSRLNRHKQSVHQGIRYACGQCHFEARRQDNLTVHIKKKHCTKSQSNSPDLSPSS